MNILRVRVTKLNIFICYTPARFLCFRYMWLRWRAAGFEEFDVFPFAVVREPVDIKELGEGAAEGSVVEAEGDEAALFVEGVAEAEGLGLKRRPVGAEGVGGHAEEEDAGVFEPFLDPGEDVVAGLEFPVVVPDAEAVGAEAFGEGADGRLVFGAVAEENVVAEVVGHALPPEACGLRRIAKSPGAWEEF